MDSLTQIVLGAAMGEVSLGKKIGNRAMVWGALAGTIPDLDVVSNLWMEEIDSLAFHRGISHSFFFSIVGAFLFGWLVHRLYQSNYHRQAGIATWVLAFLAIAGLTIFTGTISIVKIMIGIGILSLGAWTVHKNYWQSDYNLAKSVTLKEWQWMFFLGLFTHPILDTFTAYGTQLFAPFSNYRAAISNISVADPIYTILFMTPMIILAFFNRENPIRRKLIWTGIILSSMYMCFTMYNKYKVSNIMKDTLEQENIAYKKYFTSPTILNNILWSGVAETDEHFYYGQYSLLDKEPVFKLNKIEKRHDLIADAPVDDHVINTLKWFSNGYYGISQEEDGSLKFNDMRYGSMNSEPGEKPEFVFSFPIEKSITGSYSLGHRRSGPPEDMDTGEMASRLWERIKGE